LNQETPLFTKTFDLLVYLLQVSEKFPRNHRLGLGRRLQEVSLGFIDLLLEARKCPVEARPALLQRADVDLDRLRYTVRLCQELGLLTPSQYQYAAGLLVETGKLLGKWLQRYNAP